MHKKRSDFINERKESLQKEESSLKERQTEELCTVGIVFLGGRLIGKKHGGRPLQREHGVGVCSYQMEQRTSRCENCVQVSALLQ